MIRGKKEKDWNDVRKKRSGKTKRRGRDVIIMCGDSVRKEGV